MKKACTSITKAGQRCRANPLKGTDYCISHSDKKIQESVGFGGSDLGQGRKPCPKPTTVMRNRVEAAVDKLLEPYFKALGITGFTADGEPIIDDDVAARVIGRSKDQVWLTDIADLGARIEAAEHLLDRVYGRPKQTQEITGAEGGPVEVVAPTEEERQLEVARILKVAGNE